MEILLKSEEESRFLLLVAYSPNKMPLRGADGYIDVARPEVLEKACWRFMDNGAQAGMWHEAGHEKAARVVENYIFRSDVPWVVKCPDGSEQVVQKGDWVVGLILSPKAWRMFKAGLIGGGSLQGGAKRSPASQETLAYLRSA